MNKRPDDRMRVGYDWVIEHCTADEHEDILDLDHASKLMHWSNETLRDALANKRYTHDTLGRMFTRLALMRDKGNDCDGMVDRQYAYVDEDGNLPDECEEGAKVPAKYKAELAAARKALEEE